MAGMYEETQTCGYSEETESNRVQREIDDYKRRIEKKEAYLAFLKAHPEFEEYQKLKYEAGR